MTVAFFLGGLRHGGAESLVYDICRKRAEAPFDLCILYRKDDDFSDAFRSTGAEMIRVRRTGNMLKYMRALRKAVLDHHIDIVHAQTASNAMVSILALLFTKVKVVTTFHGFSFSDAPKWYRKLVYAGSKRMVCVSEFEKRHYEQKWGLPADNKLRVVHNGIDFSKLDNPQPDLSHPVSVDDQVLNLVMVGSFIEGRAQPFVCRVLHRLDQRGVPFHMYFAGRRDEAEPWRFDDCVAYCRENGLADKVSFLGNRSDIPWLLRQMDLFLYATDHDTFGIAVIEAIASGLPVLVNDWDVMKEVTRDGAWATLFQTGNEEDCVSQILAWTERRTEAPADAVRTHYSIENHIKALHRIYEEASL